MKENALKYLNAGLSVLPANVQLKYAALQQWKSYQHRRPTDVEVRAWFSNGHTGVCIVAGAVSGNLEMMDFDLQAELFEPWCERVKQADPALLDQLVIETSQSGGRHVMYRCDSAVSGNLKLAQRKVPVPSGDEIIIGGKSHKPRKDKDGQWTVLLTLIETRGQGGLFLCAPTPGYTLLQGDLTDIPVLTAEQRELLLEAAWSLNELIPEPVDMPPPSPSSSLRPGDDYNARGDVRALLDAHGWTCVKGGENEYWRRPGKTIGWSATFKEKVFYVWSSNASPFEPEKAYSPFSVYAQLEHHGDFGAAAAELSRQGYGETAPDTHDVDISAIVDNDADTDRDNHATADPGALPMHLLSVPGFINELADYMLETAPHPEPVLSFFGALCLQAFLAGRKVRDAQDNRTNIYLLGLAYPGCGKDHPRKVNNRILYEAGASGALADGFASGEGIEDKMFVNPSMLFQTDEIDSLISATSKGRDARIDMIINVLLKMFSSANVQYPMRVKAGKKDNEVIDQPSLVIYGTAVPDNYYQALSSKMLTNGFFARMLVVEAGPRTPEQDCPVQELPESLVNTARHWVNFMPGHGNLSSFHPVPMAVPHTDSAKALQRDYGQKTDAEYDKAQQRSDLVTMAIWGRASEKARRLALIYACSENALNPKITDAAVIWATELIDYATQRMLFMASQYVSESDFHAKCQQLLRVLRQWKSKKGDKWMPYYRVSQKLPWPDRDHIDVRTALINQRRVEYVEQSTGGPSRRLYRILEP